MIPKISNTNWGNIHCFTICHNIFGYGTKAMVLFQGCTRCCTGCQTPNLQAVGTAVDCTKLLDEFEAFLCQNPIDGLVISGGDPFLQPELMRTLILRFERTQERLGRPFDDILIYTGFTCEELCAQQNPYIIDILQNHCALLIDGPYERALDDNRGIRGSTNQRYLFFRDMEDRYRPFFYARCQEIQVNSNGTFCTIGLQTHLKNEERPS